MTIQSFYDDECVPYPDLVEEGEDLFTRLYDANGNKLYKESVKIKLGFDLSG